MVDDHADTRAFMKAALEGAGYVVRTAAEGVQALALQSEWRAELLITDIFMPVQDGFKTISRCKTEFPQTKIIVTSAGRIPGLTHDFLAAAAHVGVAATLRKPFTADELLDCVRKVLSR